MTTYGVIYRITCLVNGKVYHGQTLNPKERWAHHLRADSHCHALRNAIQKHGRNSFRFEVVAEASSKEDLDSLEIEHVATSMYPKGYNLVGGGANGRPSEETRRKLSVAGKIAQNRPEVKARNSAGVRRAMARPDVKEQHRAALKKAALRPGARENRRTRMLEVHARPEEREKRSASLKAAWSELSEQDREARLLAQKASYTDEVRIKISHTSRIVLARPETKEKHRKAVTDSWTVERREEMSRRSREAHAQPDAAKRGAAISRAHNTPEGKRKLAMRRRRGESEEAWARRIQNAPVEGA